MEDGVIGQLEAYIWLTKFQKNGLPHRHLLAIATEEFTAYMMDPKNLINLSVRKCTVLDQNYMRKS